MMNGKYENFWKIYEQGVIYILLHWKRLFFLFWAFYNPSDLSRSFKFLNSITAILKLPLIPDDEEYNYYEIFIYYIEYLPQKIMCRPISSIVKIIVLKKTPLHPWYIFSSYPVGDASINPVFVFIKNSGRWGAGK